jgi:hypothetical protein
LFEQFLHLCLVFTVAGMFLLPRFGNFR